MNYDENMMLEYISYLSRTMYDYDPDFDGYVRLDPVKVQANKNLTIDQQNKALKGLIDGGQIDWYQSDEIFYARLLREHRIAKSTYQPRSEEERRWINLAIHTPTYQHGKTLHEYVEEANQKEIHHERTDYSQSDISGHPESQL